MTTIWVSHRMYLGTFDLWCFKDIWGTFGELAMYHEIWISKCYFRCSYYSFPIKHFIEAQTKKLIIILIFFLFKPVFSSAWLCQQSYCHGAGVLSFSLTWDPMGAKISKRYSSSFHPIWAKLYDKLGSHEGIKSYGIYWRSAKI